jgi:large subunit ribosomal protein L21
MFAVIKTGGKQYVVKEGDVLHVEKLGTGAGGTVLFEDVLLVDDGEKTVLGTPLVAKAVVKAAVLEIFRDDKVLVFKKKRRKQFRRTRGHRQTLAKVRIMNVFPDRSAVPASELETTHAPVVAAARPAPQKKAKTVKPAAKPVEEKPVAKKPAAAKAAKTPKAPKPKKAAETAKPKTRAKKAEK